MRDRAAATTPPGGSPPPWFAAPPARRLPPGSRPPASPGGVLPRPLRGPGGGPRRRRASPAVSTSESGPPKGTKEPVVGAALRFSAQIGTRLADSNIAHRSGLRRYVLRARRPVTACNPCVFGSAPLAKPRSTPPATRCGLAPAGRKAWRGGPGFRRRNGPPSAARIWHRCDEHASGRASESMTSHRDAERVPTISPSPLLASAVAMLCPLPASLAHQGARILPKPSQIRWCWGPFDPSRTRHRRRSEPSRLAPATPRTDTLFHAPAGQVVYSRCSPS